MSKAEKPSGRDIVLSIEETAENMQAVMERHGFASKEAVQFGRNETHALLALPAPPAHGTPLDLQMYLTGLVEGVVRTNVRLAEELLLADSPRALARLQQRFVCEYFAAVQRGIAALVHATNRLAEEPALLQRDTS